MIHLLMIDWAESKRRSTTARQRFSAHSLRDAGYDTVTEEMYYSKWPAL